MEYTASTSKCGGPFTPGADDGCFIMAEEDLYKNIVLLEETRGLMMAATLWQEKIFIKTLYSLKKQEV